MTERSAVKNAADPQQVQAAGRRDQKKVSRELANIRAVLQTPAGRAVLYQVVLDAGTRSGIFDHSGSVTYFKAGRQNFGFELQSQFEKADQDAWALAQAEHREAMQTDERTTDAAQVKSATEEKS